MIPPKIRAGVTVARAHARVPERPDRLYRALLAMAPWKVSLPGVVAAAAARYPDDLAIVDDDGVVTYAGLWRRSQALAAGLAREGVDSRAVVGVLARNGRTFVEAMLAGAALGADLVFLNTSFAGPQLGDVVAAERVDVILHDDELAELARRTTARCFGRRAMSALSCGPDRLRPPPRRSRLVILTSGTTGRPKGASRRGGGLVETTAALVGSLPLRPGSRTVIAAPLFHAWGLTHLLLALSMGSTAVVRGAFEPESVLGDIERHRATALVVVPVMLQRILALGGETLVRYDTSTLRLIASSGSALPGHVATEMLDRFGPVLYNVYGSTEVATATVATPDDLRRFPTTAGRAAPGVRLEVLDDDGRPVPTGVTGRIFVGNAGAFDGYTDGADKERLGTLVSSGDVGHRDAEGRLFVDGRADDMIVSGGENVFPSEVEELLAHHPAIAEVAVVGAPDDEFGQALSAFVVTKRDVELGGDDVRTYVRDRLARYKVPRRVTFLDELPRNATGKVVKALLG